MVDIILRSVKGSPLTNTEGDSNFTNLNTGKIELGGDLGGTITQPLVISLRGSGLDVNPPANNQHLIYRTSSNNVVWSNTDPVFTSNATGVSLTLFNSDVASINTANATNAGVFTSSLWTKLSNIEANAQVNVPTDLSFTSDSTTLTIESSTGNNVTLLTANATSAGIFSAADKTKLNGIATGAQVNVPTDLGTTANSSTVTITSSTGNDVIIPDATESNAGVFAAIDKTKLNGIATGAQVNVPTDLTVTANTTAIVIASSTGTNATVTAANTTASGLVTTLAQTFAGAKTFSANVSVTGDITATGEVTAFSDRRLKNNIEVIENALDIICAINGVRFTWNDSALKFMNDREKETVGVIAQEVEVVLPEAITEFSNNYTANETYKLVAYDKLIPVLIQAIKELNEKVERLSNS
jgi:alpha-L-fucosidase